MHKQKVISERDVRPKYCFLFIPEAASHRESTHTRHYNIMRTTEILWHEEIDHWWLVADEEGLFAIENPWIYVLLTFLLSPTRPSTTALAGTAQEQRIREDNYNRESH